MSNGLKNRYNFDKTFVKILWSISDVLLVGLAVYFTKEFKYLSLIPVIVGMRDYIKHSKLNDA